MIARVLFACLLACLAFPAFARNDLPSFDPVRTCTETARRSGARDNVASPNCIKNETDARDGVARLWPELSASARSRCIRAAERRQSFLILSGCAEREAAIER